MLNTETFLFIYYIGGGYVIVLLWMCVSDPSGRPVGPAVRRRLHLLAGALAVVGALHPVLALAGRDIAQQLRGADGPPDPRAHRTLRLTSWGFAVALGVLVLVIVSQLRPFEDAPGFRQIREALPYG